MSDNSYNLSRDQQSFGPTIETVSNQPHQLKQSADVRKQKKEAPDSPFEDVTEDDAAPSYASSELNQPLSMTVEENQALVGPKDPEVVAAFDEAAKWITQAKEEENEGNVRSSVTMYKKGLTYLYRAYESERSIPLSFPATHHSQRRPTPK